MSRIRLKDTNKCLEVDVNTLSGESGNLNIGECCIPNLHEDSTMASYCGTNSTHWSTLKNNVLLKNTDTSKYIKLNNNTLGYTNSKNESSKWILETSLDNVVPIGGIWIPVVILTYNNKYLVTWENNTLKVNENISINDLKGSNGKTFIESSTIWIKEEGDDSDKAPLTGKNPNYNNYVNIAMAKINTETTLANEDGSNGYKELNSGICKVTNNNNRIECNQDNIGNNKFKIKSYNQLNKIPLNDTDLNFTIYDGLYYLKSPNNKSICVNSNNYLDTSFGNTGETDDERSLYYIIPINPNAKQLFGFHLDENKIHGNQTFMLKPARNMSTCIKKIPYES